MQLYRTLNKQPLLQNQVQLRTTQQHDKYHNAYFLKFIVFISLSAQFAESQGTVEGFSTSNSAAVGKQSDEMGGRGCQQPREGLPTGGGVCRSSDCGSRGTMPVRPHSCGSHQGTPTCSGGLVTSVAGVDLLFLA